MLIFSKRYCIVLACKSKDVIYTSINLKVALLLLIQQPLEDCVFRLWLPQERPKRIKRLNPIGVAATGHSSESAHNNI